MAPSGTRQRAAAYLVCAIFSLAYMGNGGEFCGLFVADCPSRLSAMIAMGVLTFVCSTTLTVLTSLEKLPQMAEAGLAAFTALLNTCGMAIVASPRSYYSTGSFNTAVQNLLIPALLFSIVAEVAVIVALYLVVSQDGSDTIGFKTMKSVDPAPAVVLAPLPQQYVPPPPPMQMQMQTAGIGQTMVPPPVGGAAPPSTVPTSV